MGGGLHDLLQYYIGGGLPNFLQYYIEGGLESLLQYYSLRIGKNVTNTRFRWVRPNYYDITWEGLLKFITIFRGLILYTIHYFS